MNLDALLLVGAGAILAACAADLPASSTQAAITNGTIDPGDPAVVALVSKPVACGAAPALFCSGTLIAPRVVLTAAHCVSGEPPASIEVRIGPDVSGGDAIDVIAVVVDPGWTDPENRHDIALVELARDAPVTPLTLAALADGVAIGGTVRIVGFGDDEAGGAGTKREGVAEVAGVEARTLAIVPGPAMSCNGDSGGPVLLGNDVVGVTSYGDPECVLSGVNTRVGAYRASLVDPVVDQINGRPAPAARPDLDPAVDYCSSDCTADADCPDQMGCAAGRCAWLGLETGRFGAECTRDAECGDRFCAANCRCFTPCAARGDGSGCAVAAPAPARCVWLLMLLGVVALVQVRHHGGRQVRRRKADGGPGAAPQT